MGGPLLCKLSLAQGQVESTTDGVRCLCMNLVEGQAVILKTKAGTTTYNYAESFIVPAATGWYRLESVGGPVKVLEVFLKDEKQLESNPRLV